MKDSQALLDLYVLDAMADDIEDVESILRMLNNPSIGWRDEWGKDFERLDVVTALSRLAKAGQVVVYRLDTDGKELIRTQDQTLPPSTYDDFWFGLSPAGRIRHQTWKARTSASE
ncbi:MAG TPA: hypothetical protein VK573_00935 [Gemmatimonadales bacterium]|nr:hypothetical protein [Gemmatimonadales bacterium]